jgi:hypothetical protein
VKNSSALPESGTAEAKWLGEFDFELLNLRGWRIGTVHLVIGVDVIELFSRGVNMASMNRRRFGAWLQKPAEPFTVDAVTWFRDESRTNIMIDGSLPYRVSADAVERLKQIV